MRTLASIQIVVMLTYLSTLCNLLPYSISSIDLVKEGRNDTLLKNKDLEDLGEISYVYRGFAREGSSNYFYSVNGLKHIGYDDRNGRFKLGQKYVVYVGDTITGDSFLKIDNPAFYYTDTIVVAAANIIEVSKWSVTYSYHFGGKFYQGTLVQKDWMNALSTQQHMICLIDFNFPDVSILVPEEIVEGDQMNFNKCNIGDTCLFLNWLERANSYNIADSVTPANTNHYLPGLYYFPSGNSMKFKKTSLLSKKLYKRYLEHLKMAQKLGFKSFLLNSATPVFHNSVGAKYRVDLNKLSNPYKLIYFNGVDPPRTINIFTETNKYSILRSIGTYE